MTPLTATLFIKHFLGTFRFSSYICTQKMYSYENGKRLYRPVKNDLDPLKEAIDYFLSTL